MHSGNPRKTSGSTKPEIRENRRVAPRTYQRAEHYKTWDFAEPPRCAFWKTLGKQVGFLQVFLRNQKSRKIVGLA